MPLTFCDVVTPHVVHLWDQVEPHIRRPLARQPTVRWHENDVLKAILEEKAKLWIAWDEETKTVAAAVVTQIIDHPRCRDCFIWLVGGSRLREWAQAGLDMVEAYARHMNCTCVTGSTRKGWLRIGTGYRDTGVMMEKVL